MTIQVYKVMDGETFMGYEICLDSEYFFKSVAQDRLPGLRSGAFPSKGFSEEALKVERFRSEQICSDESE